MDLEAYIDSNAERFVEDLRRLCRQPSVSAQAQGIGECVQVVREMMAEAGLEVRVLPVEGGNPVVLGRLEAEGAKGCIGFYNHYDVQPPEPLELWESGPFEAEVRRGRVFARGVDDNKGNLVARLKAVEAVREVTGRVPVNVKFFVEGEEEIGSPHLPGFVKDHMDRLGADGYLWEGDGVDGKGRPVVTLGAKGILYLELRTKGANRDVHSSRAPVIPNPAWRLIWALASMKGADERIQVPGWYDDVKEPTQEEERLLQEAPFEEEKEKKRLGLEEFLGGLSGVESRRALYFSTTCNICGFGSGYIGPGSKTILPSTATAKVDFRLVEAQRPDDLAAKIQEHLRREGFGDVEVVMMAGYKPAKTPATDPFAVHVIETARRVYGRKPVVWPTTAGTSPIYTIRNWMGIPVASSGGIGYPGSNVHSPNENIRIKDYLQSIKYIATLITTYRGKSQIR